MIIGCALTLTSDNKGCFFFLLFFFFLKVHIACLVDPYIQLYSSCTHYYYL